MLSIKLITIIGLIILGVLCIPYLFVAGLTPCKGLSSFLAAVQITPG